MSVRAGFRIGLILVGSVTFSGRIRAAECFEFATGKLVWEERLHGPGKTGQNWSSVMLADGNRYTITQGGDCFVFKASPTFALLAINSLGERSNSSIAVCNGELFIRTHGAAAPGSRRAAHRLAELHTDQRRPSRSSVPSRLLATRPRLGRFSAEALRCKALQKALQTGTFRGSPETQMPVVQ